MGSVAEEPTPQLAMGDLPEQPAEPRPAAVEPSSHPWRRLFILIALFFVVGASWSFSTAPGGSPDEIQHVFRAWTVWDDQIVLDPVNGGGASGDVAEGLISAGANKIICFVFKPDVTADCGEPWSAEMGPPLTTLLLAGRYNPVYYLAVGWPLRFTDPLTAIYAMRLVSSLLSAVLIALAATAASLRLGAPLARAGVLVGLTPMALFLSGSVNPSGLEIAAAVCGWTGVVLLARAPDHPAARWWAASAGIGLSMMVLSRPASFIWLVPIAAVSVILVNKARWKLLLHSPAAWVAVGSIAASVGFVLIWARIARTSDVTAAVPFGDLRDGFVNALQAVSGWWLQQVGVLGYLDTLPPASVVAATAGSVLVPLVLVLAWARGRDRLAQLAAVAAALAVPVAASTALYPEAGNVWQGRYNMPVSVGMVILAGILLDSVSGLDGARRLSVARWIAGLWAFAGVAMVFYNLQRYAVGDSASYLFIINPTPWSPPLPILMCVALAAVGYVGTAIYLFRGSGADDDPVLSSAGRATTVAVVGARPE